MGGGRDVRHGGHHVLYNNNNNIIGILYTIPTLFASPGVGGICYDDARNDDDDPGIIILL